MLVGEVFWGIINDEKKIKREGRNTIRTNVRQGAIRWTKLTPENMNINCVLLYHPDFPLSHVIYGSTILSTLRRKLSIKVEFAFSQRS